MEGQARGLPKLGGDKMKFTLRTSWKDAQQFDSWAAGYEGLKKIWGHNPKMRVWIYYAPEERKNIAYLYEEGITQDWIICRLMVEENLEVQQ